MAQEETFSIPLKYIDVTRSTHTDLDVMQEKRVDDYWNVDSNRSLSDSWKGFTNFSVLCPQAVWCMGWSIFSFAALNLPTCHWLGCSRALKPRRSASSAALVDEPRSDGQKHLAFPYILNALSSTTL